MASKTITSNFLTMYPFLAKVGLANVVISLCVVVVSSLVAPPSMFLSIVIGMCIGMVNLALMTKTVKQGLSINPEKVQQFVMWRYYMRLFATIVVTGILIIKKIAEPAGLIIGLSILMVITVMNAIYFARKEIV